MKKIITFLVGYICLFFLHGSSGVGSDEESVSVMEGDSVTLHTGVKTTQKYDVIWFFNKTCIARISGNLSYIPINVLCNIDNERFRDRMELDHQTGSLTIMNITNTDSGEYNRVLLNSSGGSGTVISVTVNDVPAAQRDEKKTKSVVEGQSVTLDPGVTKNPNDVMTWHFNETLIAEITGDQSKICSDVQSKERFRDRLKLNNQTGSLTITNTRTTDSGDYKLLISSSSSSVVVVTSLKSFSISITAVPGLSPAAVGGICVALLLVVCVVGGLAIRKRVCMQQNNQENNVL